MFAAALSAWAICASTVTGSGCGGLRTRWTQSIAAAHLDHDAVGARQEAIAADLRLERRRPATTRFEIADRVGLAADQIGLAAERYVRLDLGL
jgi:hypothetical protein